MTKSEQTNESPVLSYLAATAEQLDIAAEDVDSALDEILETFEATANYMKGLEKALNQENFDREGLEKATVELRKMLRQSVINLQFQDRLMQRMALASRELRQLAADQSVGSFQSPGTDLKVPKSVSSLYNRHQMLRIVDAAGGSGEVFQDAAEPADDDNDNDNDIELF